MKKIIFLLVAACCIFVSCKDENAPRSTEEVKSDAIQCVENFIASYNNGEDFKDFCLDIINLDLDRDIEKQVFGDEYYCSRMCDYAKLNNVHFSQSNISIDKNVKEIREKEKLLYCLVEVKDNGKKVVFKVCFLGIVGNGKTGTEGKPKIVSTIGLYKFDNAKFKEKTGFTLEWDQAYDDMTPYINYNQIVQASKKVKSQLKNKKLEDTEIESVSINEKWLEKMFSHQEVKNKNLFIFNCTNNVKVHVGDDLNITKFILE